ncbi:putative T6SS immunity periplasmic lipoprotein [Enterobacter sp. C2]|uniref:putative T6SS immunity periplasmic lipoprotein n=1 Tax=Enterobacter sp. C2 TaxID=2870346 RepID=UPI001CA3A802|nr:putative T6SS immunity periplasmic lipoprotein [Enterobacter sp. C2]
MNKLVILPVIFLLSGCPGGNPAPHPRATFINGDHLCFSTDNKDVLNYYTVDESENGKIQIVVSSGYNKLNSSYPGNCVDVKWKSSHTYVINYGLNDKKYVHEFFIDSNGKLDSEINGVRDDNKK